MREGLLSEQDRRTIGKTCGQSSWAFAKCVLAMGMLDEDELAAFFAERTKYQVAPRNLLNHLDQHILESIDPRMVARLEVLPIRCEDDKIRVAVADPLDKSILRQIEFFTGLEVQPVIAPLSQIYAGLKRLIPDFQPQYTALSSFLHNHAASAWQQQRVIEEIEFDETGMTSSRRQHGLISDPTDDGADELAEESLHDLYEEDLEEEEDLAGDLVDDVSLNTSEDSDDFDDVDVDHADDMELSQGADELHDEDISDFDLSALDDDPPSPGSKKQAASSTPSSPIDELDFEDDSGDLDLPPSEKSEDGDDEHVMEDAKLTNQEDDVSDDDFFGTAKASSSQPNEANTDDLADDFDLLAPEETKEDELAEESLSLTEDDEGTENDLFASSESATSADDESLFSGEAGASDLATNEDTNAMDAEADLGFADAAITPSDEEGERPAEDSPLDIHPDTSESKNSIFQELAHKTTQGTPLLEGDDDDLLDEFPADLNNSKAMKLPQEKDENELIMKTQPQVRLDGSDDHDEDDFADFDLDDEDVDGQAQTAFTPLNSSSLQVDDEDELLAETQFGGEDMTLDDDVSLGDHMPELPNDGPMIREHDLIASDLSEPSVTMERDLSFTDEPKIDLPRFTEAATGSSKFSNVAQINQALLRLSLVNQKEVVLNTVVEALAASLPQGFIISLKDKQPDLISAWTEDHRQIADTSTIVKIFKKYLGANLKNSEPGNWQDCHFSASLAKLFPSENQSYRLYLCRHTSSAQMLFIGSLPEGKRASLEDAVGPLLDQLARKFLTA
ncbi:MAG: hypothetical protein ACOH5I_11310 [Oligoflexus sp.]